MPVFVIPFKTIENVLFFETAPPVGTLKVTVVAPLVIVPIAAPLKVPPVIVLSVKPEGNVIVTEAPTAIAALPLFSTLALNV